MFLRTRPTIRIISEPRTVLSLSNYEVKITSYHHLMIAISLVQIAPRNDEHIRGKFRTITVYANV